MDELALIKKSWEGLWSYFSNDTQVKALRDKGWVPSKNMPAISPLLNKVSIPEVETRNKNKKLWYRPKGLEGIENNNGWITRSLDREYGMLYAVIYKDSGKMGVIELRGPHVIRDGHTFDTQDVLPYISHWRKLDFEKPLI